MKKYISILCAVLLGVFASCSQSEVGDETPKSNQVTLKVTADEGLQTRGAAGVDRFAIEVYTDAAYTTPATEVFGDSHKANNATGLFSMILDRNQAYYCLIWADKSGNGVYDITSLKAVALTGKATEAWHGTKMIEAGTNADLPVTLARAVSKISLMETDKLKAGSTLKLNFDQPTKFNVVDGTVSTSTARPEESIAIDADVNGRTKPVKLNKTDVFALSSAATADMTELTFQYGEEEAFTVPNVPLKANFNTNIKGHYTSLQVVSFTLTMEDEDVWGDKNNEAELPGNEPEYIEVNGLKWAVGNLVVDAANGGCKIGKATDVGLCFQFGSIVCWDLINKEPTIALKPEGCAISAWSLSWTGDVARDNAVTGTGDPCRYYLKNDWRLPTKEEYKALFDNNESGDWTGGSWTWKNASAVHTSGLTFSALGYRNIHNGTLTLEGERGCFWSSSLEGGEPFGLLVQSNGFYANYPDSRNAGYSARCVQSSKD